MNEIIHTDEFEDWYRSITDAEADAVFNAIRKLEIEGLSLGWPNASAVEGADFGLRELRCKRGQSPLRVFYAYDPQRDAVLILGGDKSGDSKFYERMIRKCESIWLQYLAEHAEGLHKEK